MEITIFHSLLRPPNCGREMGPSSGAASAAPRARRGVPPWRPRPGRLKGMLRTKAGESPPFVEDLYNILYIYNDGII